ncbi:5'/3'-nucleotidase SurE [Kitasatospora sp. NPDC048365]|uniref:5'/3'-nucleotidase SurE n=1 Tax=Kitasatospora sp. NPDC048365 TaxID=3364050 RepID=UPI0037144DFC
MRTSRSLPLAAVLLSLAALGPVGPAAAESAAESAAGPAAPARPLRILLSNDDGYDAPGIRAVYERLTAAGREVTIVAPLHNASGSGTRVTLPPVLAVEHPEPRVWAVDGTPGDAVLFGLRQVFAGRAPDLVVSGTNFGPNYGGIANHSGTVGAAVAALESGVPAIAVSTDLDPAAGPQPTLNAMRPTAEFAARLIDRLRGGAKSRGLLPPGVGLNVNYPVIGDGTGTPAGVSVTTQDAQPVLVPDFADRGDGTWKVTVSYAPRTPARGSDLAALGEGRISVAPMSADWNVGPADFAGAAARLAGLRP